MKPFMRSTYKPAAPYSAYKPALKKPLLPLRQQLEALKKQVASFPDGRILFGIPVTVTTPSHIELFICHGAWADVEHGLWLMDGQGQWHKISHDQPNTQDVVTTIHQKVKSLIHERSKILPEC